MEIKPGEKIYERTKDKDIFLEYRLISAALSLATLEGKETQLQRQISDAKKRASYPADVTAEQREAIDFYNKEMAAPVGLLIERLTEVQTLIALLEALPPLAGGMEVPR